VVAYWVLAHGTFVLFRHMGVLPMPIWPSAALAIFVAFYRGWNIAPGLAVGTVLANHFSLGGPWDYAAGIAVMNTLGPLLGAHIMRRQVSSRIVISGFADLLVCFVAVVVLTPILTAIGGIGFKWIHGMIQTDDLLVGWLKWVIAHSLGSLLFATPAFAWMALKEPWK
jgi:integral membrane sensor domain MASE1